MTKKQGAKKTPTRNIHIQIYGQFITEHNNWWYKSLKIQRLQNWKLLSLVYRILQL